MRQSGSQMETTNRRYSNMDTSRRDMLLASLLATLPAMVVSEAVASPINPAQTIIQPPEDHHWVSNKNYPERSVDMCPLAGSLTEPGLYLTLVRWWPGYMSAPHTYVTDRLCVVVSGTWWCNSGDDFDPASCVPVPAGSFVRRVAGTPHYDGKAGSAGSPMLPSVSTSFFCLETTTYQKRKSPLIVGGIRDNIHMLIGTKPMTPVLL